MFPMSDLKVKICGVTSLEDAVMACKCGADLLGFIFAPETPRVVSRETVKDIVDHLVRESAKVKTVGLFKNARPHDVVDTVNYCGLDYIQLHGLEKPSYCRSVKDAVPGCKIIKAFKVKEKILSQGYYRVDDYEDVVDYFVFDTFHPEMSGGTGESFDWNVLVKESAKINKPFFLAGGLDHLNVRESVETVRPYGVDVSSGVERVPREKDENILKEFIQNAKEA